MLHPGRSAHSSSSYDWSASRLGEPRQWPQALRLAADVMFNTPLPLLLVWGRDMTVLFNDAYGALAGPAYGRVPGGSVPPVMPPPLAVAGDELQRAWSGEAAFAPDRNLMFAGGQGGRPVRYLAAAGPPRPRPARRGGPDGWRTARRRRC